jgi:hypothetical protein
MKKINKQSLHLLASSMTWDTKSYETPPTSPRRSDQESPPSHFTKEADRRQQKIHHVCVLIDAELKKLFEALNLGDLETQIWTCQSSFTTDFINSGGILAPPASTASNTLSQVVGITRNGELGEFPLDAVIKYLEVGKYGEKNGGINIYEQAFINVCVKIATHHHHPKDNESIENAAITQQKQIMDLWMHPERSEKTTSHSAMFGVIVIGFRECWESPMGLGSVGWQLAYDDRHRQ